VLKANTAREIAEGFAWSERQRPDALFVGATAFLKMRVPIPMRAGRPARFDYEYERNGTANLFMLFAPPKAGATSRSQIAIPRWITLRGGGRDARVLTITRRIRDPMPAREHGCHAAGKRCQHAPIGIAKIGCHADYEEGHDVYDGGSGRGAPRTDCGWTTRHHLTASLESVFSSQTPDREQRRCTASGSPIVIGAAKTRGVPWAGAFGDASLTLHRLG
jgi:hypothetical protein